MPRPGRLCSSTPPTSGPVVVQFFLQGKAVGGSKASLKELGLGEGSEFQVRPCLRGMAVAVKDLITNDETTIVVTDGNNNHDDFLCAKVLNLYATTEGLADKSYKFVSDTGSDLTLIRNCKPPAQCFLVMRNDTSQCRGCRHHHLR